MHIINFLTNLLATYWIDTLIILVFLVVCAVLIKRGKKDLVSKIVYALVVQAEQQLGSKTGQEKYAHVMAQIYGKLPLILRLLFTREDIEKFIEDSVTALKRSLSLGRIDLLTYAQEKDKTPQNVTVNVTQAPVVDIEQVAKTITNAVTENLKP